MAWTPPSDAVEAREQTATTGGWNPPSDALEVRPPKASIEDLGSPMGDDMGSAIMSASSQPKPERKVYTGSVFDTQPFEPEFNAKEAERLSRREYAEKGPAQPRRTQSMRATPADQIERSAGRAIADTGIGLLQGAAGIPKGIASNINAGDNPVSQFFDEAIQAGERSKSPYLRGQQVEREALLKNVLENQGELAQTRAAFNSMFSPAGADVVAQGAGSMLPTMGMSLLNLGQKSFVAMNALANAGDAAQGTAKELAQMSPQEWSNSSAYQELRGAGLSHRDAVNMLTPLMAMPAQLVGGGAGAVSGSTGFEKTLAGKGIKGGARERVARAGAELAGEELETLAPSLVGNITQRMIDEKKSITENLGREAVETLFGSTPGMALAASGRSKPEAPKELDTRGLADRMARERGFLEPVTRTERPAPAERPTPVQERVEPAFKEEALAPAAPKSEDDLTLQRAQEQADVLALEQPRTVAEIEAEYQQAMEEIDASAKAPTTQGLYDRLGLPEGAARENAVNEPLDFDDKLLLKKMIVKTVDGGLEAGKTRQKIAAQLEALTKGGIKPSDFQKIHDYMTERGVKETPEPEAATKETPQQKFKRLSSKSIGMTNAFRDRIITNQEFDKFKADLEDARQAAEQEAPDLSALSPAKREILEIADKLEAAGVKGFPRGMRSNARPEAREPDEKAMEFYRSKLQPYEEKQSAPEIKKYGLPEFFSDNEKEVARITGLMKSGPLKTRVALGEANDSIQRLADTIQAAGFDINNLVPGQVPDGIMKIKSQIGNIAARSNRLAAAAEAVQKKYKRADPKRVKDDAAGLMADIEEADNLIAEDQNVPSAAEQMEGVAAPDSPEVEELLKKSRLAADDIEILSKRSAGTSLMKVLEGSLKDGEMSELGGKSRQIGKNPFISLVAKKGKRGSSMEDMVESGKLNLFLPFGKRSGEPGYDNAESAEYIREKLRTGEFYTDDIRQEIENIQRGIWSIDEEIQQELSLEDINREIQYAADEQRAIDQETAELAPEGAPEALDEGTREEDELIKSQTKEELKAKQDEIDRLSKENERLSKEAERKAKADEEAGDFVLTGSKRDADKAAARGQMDLTEAAEEPGETVDENDTGFIGASDEEVADVAKEFDLAAKRQDYDKVTRVFDAPEKGEIVRAENKTREAIKDSGYMTVKQAKQRIEEWKKNAQSQSGSRANSEKVVLSLFDTTGEWSKPWEEAGYQVYRFDIQDDPEFGDVNKFSSEFFNDLFGAFEGQDVYAILAACPCTDFAVSGSRYFAAKDADGRTVESVKLVQQTLATVEYFKPSVWAIENPVGRIEKLTGLPPWRLSFNPNHFGDPYTKKTLLWGRFNADLPIAPVEPTEGSKMARMYGGKSQATKNARSVTPEGFAYAFFEANNAIDNPVMAVANKYDMLDRKAVEAAVDAKMTDQEIADVVDDPYYMDLDYDAASAALQEAAEGDQQTFRSIEQPKAPSTDSAAFKRWFGDSKVVDADGKPLVVYHGTDTDEDFVAFDTMDFGSWFAENEYTASGYTTKSGGGGSRMIPVYLKIENPLNIPEDIDLSDDVTVEEALNRINDENGTTFEPADIDLPEDFIGSAFEFLAQDQFIDLVKSAGFDGMHALEGGDWTWNAFSPTQIKSAIGNIGTYDSSNPDITKSLEEDLVTLVTKMADEMAEDEKKRSPSLVRTLKTYNRQRNAGKMSEATYIIMSDAAIRADEERRTKEDPKDRERGYLHIQEKLSAAVRRGELPREAFDLANWFMSQNEDLVADLGISIKGKGPAGTGGFYNAMSRVMTLIKDGGSELTATHEILHHLERMMPAKVQQAIRKAWLNQLTKASKATKDPVEKLYFEAVLDANLGNNRHTMLNPIEGAGKAYANARMALEDMAYGNTSAKLAEMLLLQRAVPIDMYQYFNPSEFWAVNGSRIAQGRYDAVKGGVLIKMKKWLGELGQKIKSALGLKSDASIIRALDSLNKGDGKFQTDEMLSKGDNYAAITGENMPRRKPLPTQLTLFQKEGGSGRNTGKNIFGRKPLANWTMPDTTNLDSFIYSIQNKQIDMKRAVDSIKDAVGQIDERFDPYMKETLFAGRTATQTKRFLQNELEPLFKEMGRLGVNMPELEEYLHNRHAQERNEQIATVNEGMPDKGSGIATADAQKYLANLTPDQKTKYGKLAGMVDAIAAGTRQLLVDSGLESQKTIDQWESTYDNYVPLNRDDIDYSSNHGMGVGQGYSVRGSASKRAVGSERKVVDILANIAMQRERNIVRAEKNRVAMALYGMAIQNPNPDFFLAVNPDAKQSKSKATKELVGMGFLPSDINSLMNEPGTMEIDPQTGLVVERIHKMQRGADNVMGLRVDGENRYVFFNQNNERASRMASAIKNLDADQLGLIMSTMADATRFLAAMNTQYNPIFGAYNFLRDVSTAGLQLTNTPLAGKQAEVLSPKNVWGAMRGIYTDLRAERKGGVGMGDWAKLWEEFQQRGGQTGFRDQFSSTAKRGEALQRIVDPSSWANSGLGKVFTANGTLKVPAEVARKAAAPLFNWLSDYNETMENAIRLSAYKAGLDNGMSKDAAAVMAKELTVNFNRKGQIATQAGALYAFFNASVQGTTALAKTLSGPAGKKIIAGGLMLGGIQAVLYSMAGFDDKEPPDFIREKNFVIPDFITRSGKYIAIPLPLGYNVIPNTSRLLTEAAIRGIQGKKIKPTETLFKIFESLLGAFNPIGNAGWSFQTAAPTVADPIVALMENRDWTGKKIAREDFNSLDPTPGFTRYKESASTFSRGLAEFMNSMSDGTKDAPGRISPTPDQIDYFIGQIFGGVGREALKIERAARSMVTGEELPPHAIPLAGRFYGDTKGSSAVSNTFYENLKQMNIHENAVKGMRQRKENVQQYYKENPEARMFEEAGRVEREVQALRKRRRELVEKKAPKEFVRAAEARITARMKRFNDKIKQREEQQK